MKLSKHSMFLANLFCALLVVAIMFGISNFAFAQERSKYLQGVDNTVEMIVHIIGQVQRPGKYRVRDDTNLIELLSEAGGPTEFSNLSNVTITHAVTDLLANGHNGTNHKKYARIIKYNVNKYLKEDNASPAPILKPGDVVLVPTNKWRSWRTASTIFRDLAVVASAYFLYLRAVK